MKKLLSLFVALLLAACTVFGAAAASGSVNLTEFTFQYYHRYTSGLGYAVLPVDDHSYRWITDIDLSSNTHLQFSLDTRILPGYTYHFKIMFYMGEDSIDDNFWDLESESYCVLYDGDTRFLCYPTIQRSYSNTFTTFDVFIRFDPGTDRGNQVSAGNYTSIGLDTVLADFSSAPFDYEGVFVSLKQFAAVYDFDGSELDAMIAGFSDVKRGIDSVGSKLDDISGKLDNIQDDVKQGEIDAKEWEKEQAEQQANDSIDDVNEALEDSLDLTGVDTVFNSFLSIMNYEGTELSFSMPTVKIPAMGEFIPETVLIEEQDIPFETWLADSTVEKIISVINVLSVIGFCLWVIKQFMYWIDFFSGSGDVHKLVDEGYGGNADPYGS